MTTQQKPDKMKVTDNAPAPGSGIPLPTANASLPAAITSLNAPTNQSHAAALSSAAAPASNSLQPLPDPILKLKIDSLKEKQRADSFFNSLPPEQARQVMGWIDSINSLVDVWNRVTRPAPEGLGLKVNLQTLRRLRDAWRAEDLANMATSSLDIVLDLEDQTGLNHAVRFQTAMNQMLSERAFDLMRTEPRCELLPELLANIKKLTELELKRQKLQLEREKLMVKHAPRPKTLANAEQPSVQHHRVDLNIVPQNGRETVVIESEPPKIVKV